MIIERLKQDLNLNTFCFVACGMLRKPPFTVLMEVLEDMMFAEDPGHGRQTLHLLSQLPFQLCVLSLSSVELKRK